MTERELLQKAVDLIHEDVYEKTPRGQPVVGEEIQMQRYFALIELRDKIVEFLDENENGPDQI